MNFTSSWLANIIRAEHDNDNKHIFGEVEDKWAIYAYAVRFRLVSQNKISEFKIQNLFPSKSKNSEMRRCFIDFVALLHASYEIQSCVAAPHLAKHSRCCKISL